MTRHILRIELNADLAARVAAGEALHPELPDDRDWTIDCTVPGGCGGWIECREPHVCPHGIDAKNGPYGCDGCTEPPLTHTCFCDEEEVEFHGVMHTWRYSHDWTVPYHGCIVNYGDAELDYDTDVLPIGTYEVEDDWDDTFCYLLFVAEPPTPIESEAA